MPDSVACAPARVQRFPGLRQKSVAREREGGKVGAHVQDYSLMAWLRSNVRRRLAQGWFWLAHVGFPFHWGGYGETPEARRRRRFGRWAIRQQWPVWLRPFAVAGMVLLWPIGAALQTRALLHGRTAPGGQLEDAPGRFDWALWQAAVRNNASAAEAYKFGLTAKDAEPGTWIYDLETTRSLARLAAPEAIELAHDKAAFADFCARIGLVHAPTLGHWKAGQSVGPEQTTSDWPDSVVLKPTRLNNAAGLEVWHRQDGTYSKGSENLNPAQLRLRAAALSAHFGEMLAQPCLTLHPSLTARGLTGVPVARLLTGLWPDGQVTVLDAYFSAVREGQFASNAGYGPKWPLDPQNGVLQPSDARVLPRWTKASIVGMELPDWERATTLAVQGHRSFPAHVPILGWDIAFTDQGPVALETNTGVSCSVPQDTRQTPSGSGCFGQLLDAWIVAHQRRAR